MVRTKKLDGDWRGFVRLSADVVERIRSICSLSEPIGIMKFNQPEDPSKFAPWNLQFLSTFPFKLLSYFGRSEQSRCQVAFFLYVFFFSFVALPPPPASSEIQVTNCLKAARRGKKHGQKPNGMLLLPTCSSRKFRSVLQVAATQNPYPPKEIQTKKKLYNTFHHISCFIHYKIDEGWLSYWQFDLGIVLTLGNNTFSLCSLKIYIYIYW